MKLFDKDYKYNNELAVTNIKRSNAIAKDRKKKFILKILTLPNSLNYKKNIGI